MAEDQDSKTEQPTGKRLSEARDKGNVLQSQEVKTAAILSAITLLVWYVIPVAMGRVRNVLLPLLAQPAQIPVRSEADVIALIHDLAWRLFPILLVPLGTLMLVGLISAYAQVGLMFNLGKFLPDINKLNPVNGLGRLFSPHGLVEFAKNMAKLLVVGAMYVMLMWPERKMLLVLPTMEVPAILAFLHHLLVRLLMATTALVIIVAAADYYWQKYQYFKKLKMTKQEVKDEHKQADGDPLIKNKIRSLRIARARQRMMAAVPKADVVVTNPTHFACALKYDPDTMNAPVLVAKGQDLVAFRIRELAEQNDITIVENPPLARALYAAVEIDREIPPEHYKAVAEVISYVFRLKGKLRR